MPYVPANLIRSAESIDRRASWLVVGYVLAAGIIVGLAVQAIAMGRPISSRDPTLNAVPFFMGFVIGGLIGAMIGSTKAFELRLRAQLIMCMVSIEANSRRI